MNVVLAEWISKAEGGYDTARRELAMHRRPNYDAVCFHAQQCAEKYLKAFLILREFEPPQTHNLIELLKLCATEDGSFELIHPFLDVLTTYAVDIRYPGEFSTKDEARDAVKAMKRVRDFVRRKLP